MFRGDSSVEFLSWSTAEPTSYFSQDCLAVEAEAY